MRKILYIYKYIHVNKGWVHNKLYPIEDDNTLLYVRPKLT